MKQSLQVSCSPLVSAIARPSSAETDSSDYCTSGVYEFQDGDESNSLRSLGYQKPKHMWMAKDQALLNSLKSSSPSAPSVTELSTSSYVDTPPCSPSANGSTACILDSGLPSVSVATSPYHSVHLQDSPTLETSTRQSAFVVPSPLNATTSSAYSRSPPVSVDGLSTLCSVNSRLSPPSVTDVCPILCVSMTEQPLPKPVADSNRCDHPSLAEGVISTELSPMKQEPVGKPKGIFARTTKRNSNRGKSTTVEPRRRRTARPRRSDTAVSNESLKLGLKVKLPLRSIGQLPGSLESGALSSPSTRSVKSTASDCTLVRSKSSKSSPDRPSTVPGGLKIRLRRDDITFDLSSKRTKRLRNSNASGSTFRIVESWCDTDAPGGEFSRRKMASQSTSPSLLFTSCNGSVRVGDIVWAKLAGYPYWPSRVSAIWARTAHQLAQATPLPPQQTGDSTSSSLSVLATPSDPALAAGYTARVDWLAWDQCSYLSCAKLYPFKEAYEKMYNPRTRVKGYADAVRLAKRFADDPDSLTDCVECQLPDLSPNAKSFSTLSSQVSAPPSTDSHWSATNTLPCSLEPPLSNASNPRSSEAIEKDTVSVVSDTVADQIDVPHKVSSALDSPTLSDSALRALGPGDRNIDLCVANGGPASWAPLPQLDISGFGDFVSHVPTFSEDEDEIDESVARQLQLDFGPCV
ncbi:hypothetical protein CRM22_002426 [Opisthorchis felineus]|uniref:PWWP domain-containing protein n=1 Tax=Opisthorchis felineus TaxID=147828 RepID=A0A4S2M6A0_OPIFE|nr:hypothetical protein CRM22_002426 [Opisthorchis felineus]